MCENCCNMGCKYRGYNCDWHNPPEQFEWVKIGDGMRELNCKKYQPDGEDKDV